jgi:hypothetical protein
VGCFQNHEGQTAMKNMPPALIDPDDQDYLVDWPALPRIIYNLLIDVLCAALLVFIAWCIVS